MAGKGELMNMPLVRLLRADEIECRIGTINEKGLSLLLFKDARVDQKILDETFTPFGWKRFHQMIDGRLYCTVEIWDTEKQQWVGKQDVGTESYSEKEKGQASDSFKRACFNWGIGRELYTAPFIWIHSGKVAIQNHNGKFTCNERFTVRNIVYDDNRIISALSIVGSKGREVYSMCQEQPVIQKDSSLSDNGINQEQTKAMEQELKRTGVALQTVLDRYQLSSTRQMTPEIYENAMKGLKKSSSKNEKAA